MSAACRRPPYRRRARAPRVTALLVGALCAGVGASASAQFVWTATLGIAHNDNVNLSANQPVSDDILLPTLGFSYERSGDALEAQVDATLQYRDYLGGEFSDAARGQLRGLANWAIVPQRLTWTFADSLGVQPVNERQADTPANEQQVNVFSTGPTVLFGSDPTTQMRAELRYGGSYAETSDAFDSHRASAALRLVRQLNPLSKVSANVEAQQVRFEHSDAPAPDYERYNAYLGYRRAIAHLTLELAAGYTKLDLHDGADDDAGALLRAALDWQANRRNLFTLAWAQQLTDAADTMSMAMAPTALGAPSTVITTGYATISPQTFQQRRVDLGWQYSGTRLGLSLAPYAFRRDYTSAPALDQRGHGIAASASWKLRPRLSVGLHGEDRSRHYELAGSDYDDTTLGARVGYQWSAHLSWHLDLTHYRRTSSVLVDDVTQNIIYFWIAWSPDA